MVQEPTTRTSPQQPVQRGQALIEYALILVLVVMALVAAVAATGPALGNVFSNTVFNLVGITGTPQDLVSKGGPAAFWATVTYVAQNPPAARSFPTSPPKPPTATFTPGPSPTPTLMTPSATPTLTPTLPPTATPTDMGFDAPFVDTIDNPVWWRVDSSAYLGGADWLGEYFPNTTLTGTPDRTLYNQQIDPAFRFNINFSWGTTSPLDSWLTDNYSIRYTRTITVPAGGLQLNFTLAGDDGSRLIIDGTTVINNWPSSGGSITYSNTLTAGSHTLKVEYYEATGNANLTLGISANKPNVAADTNKGGGAATCPWTQITGSQPNTVAYAWKENLPTVTNGFPTNMRCNLELRGYVDLNGVVNPTMTFWDVWDFGTATDTTVKLQLAEYVPYNDDLTGGPNWTLIPGYTLHSAGKNYAWTRNQFDIPSGLLNKKMTWRFVMESGTLSSVRRWYLDDIRVGAKIATKTFGVCTISKYTCGNFWDLDVASEKDDFVTTARWDLTNRVVASNDSGGPSMSWDVSSGNLGSGGKYVKFGSEQSTTDYRIHYIAFNGQVDLRTINSDGTGGTPDWEGDLGFPILSFYQAYSLEDGDSIEVQYTRDADTPGTPANWVRVGSSAIKAVPVTGTPVSDVMKRFDLQLKDIPNWNTQTFRLRFALIVSSNKESTGWSIDNIAIEREGAMKFSDYPYCDDAEGNTDNWLMGGQWGIASTSGAFQTGNSFSDSPTGNYIHGQVTSMSLRYPIDFNNDTPENLLTGGNHSCFNGTVFGKATRPILTFWHWRKLAATDSFKIELYRAAHAPSTTAISAYTVWTYTYSSGSANQVAWEREELDMRAAIEKATGITWATMIGNTDKYDDDFYFQITLDASTNTAVSDGIYIDNIAMKEYSETSYKLWSPSKSFTAKTGAPVAGTGDGTDWLDDIDNPSDWYNRWTTGSTWTSIDWDSRSGIDSLHNVATDNTNYLHQSFNVLEMNKILDLRGTLNTDLPTMYFWTRYNIGVGDSIAVEIALQDETEMTNSPPTRALQGYDYQYLWGSATSYAGGTSNTSWGGASSWQMIWSKPASSRNDAWNRVQVDLRNYVGKRVKVRFVLNGYSDPSVGTGWWLDDIRFVFRTSDVYTVGFTDNARNMRNWIAEGNWGLAPDQWRGSGGGPADLGTNPWNLYWFDCIDWFKNNYTKTQAQFAASFLTATSCSGSNWTNFFNGGPARTVTATESYIDSRTSLVAGTHFIKDFAPDVLFDFAADDRPNGGFGSSTWYDYFAGRFFRDITVTGGTYTVIATSDDGIRVRIETAAGGTPTGMPSGTWNVIDHWSAHSRAVDYQAVTLDPGNYRIIGEYFEGTGSAVVGIQVGSNKFSFSDSPKASIASAEVDTIPYSESALILNGVINLSIPTGLTAAQWKPRLEFYQLYDFAAYNNGRVEVSTDGGFTWNQTNLNTNCPSGVTCDPNTFGDVDWTPSNSKDWTLRSHDLSYYTGQNINLRFKLVSPNGTTRDGWWITDITLGNTG